MELFLDTLDLEAIRKYSEMGVISGVTTNPTLCKRFGMIDDIDMIKKVRESLGRSTYEIHVEAFGDNTDTIINEVTRIAKCDDPSLVYKIPFSEAGVRAVHTLKNNFGVSVKTNMHLIFSHNQATIAALVGSDYICPLVGRLDDEGHCGTVYVGQIVDTFKRTLVKTKVMMSSVRHPLHIVEAIKTGVDVATVPLNVLEKMFEHTLTTKGFDLFEQDLRTQNTN